MQTARVQIHHPFDGAKINYKSLLPSSININGFDALSVYSPLQSKT